MLIYIRTYRFLGGVTRTLNISYLKAVPVGEFTTNPFQILDPPPLFSAQPAPPATEPRSSPASGRST